MTFSSTADFVAGTFDSVMVSETDSSSAGGQLRLQSPAADLFLSPTLGPAWQVTRPGGFTPTIAGGVMDAQMYAGGLPVTSSLEMVATFGVGTTCEFRALIEPGSNFSSIGFFSSTATVDQWAYFSTFGTGDDSVTVIHTSVRDSTGAVKGEPTTVTLGEWHDFRIVWLPDALEFWVDGVLIDTRTDAGLTLPLRFGMYKSAGSATPLLVDWVRVMPYSAGSGGYESVVHDAGVAGTTWTELAWSGSQPAGTGVTYETRTGETAVPDGSWSPWDAVSGTAVTSPAGRYAQYRAALATADLGTTPVIDEVRFCYDAAETDTVPPTVVETVPADGTDHIAVDVAVRATFSEPVDPATVGAATFTLTPAGGSPVAATVSVDSTGATVVLVPETPLEFSTVYTAVLSAAITDTVGLALAEDHVWTFTTASGLADAGTPGLPAVTALQANYPNPFNPRTTVAFDLAHQGPVRLRIYSVDGRLVRTLVAQDLPAGHHTVVWNGDDDLGRHAATGVYLLRMETRELTQTRKMLLMQ